MRKNRTTRVVAVAASMAMAVAVTACSQDEGDGEVAVNDIRLNVPTPAGGGFGLVAQRIQPHFAEALGVDVDMSFNDAGGQEAAVATFVANTRGSCDDVLIMGTPMLQLGTMTNPALNVLPEDLYPLGAFTQEPSVVLAGQHTGYETMEDLIEDARSRPGQVVASVGSVTDIAHLGLLEIEEATGVVFNKVFYGGGSPARDALVQGEAAISHAGVYNAQGVAGSVDFLGVQAPENLWPELTDDAPTLTEALGTDLPESVARYALFVTAECQAESPETYEILADALEVAANSDGYMETLEGEGIEGQFDWIPGTEFFADYIENSEEMYGEAVDQIMTVLDEES